MQKRHFEAIAATLRDLKPDRGNRYAPRTVKTKGEAAYGQWLATVNAFASMLGSTTLARHVPSEDEARRICAQYNTTHKPGFLSRKAEYESEG